MLAPSCSPHGARNDATRKEWGQHLHCQEGQATSEQWSCLFLLLAEPGEGFLMGSQAAGTAGHPRAHAAHLACSGRERVLAGSARPARCCDTSGLGRATWGLTQGNAWKTLTKVRAEGGIRQMLLLEEGRGGGRLMHLEQAGHRAAPVCPHAPLSLGCAQCRNERVKLNGWMDREKAHSWGRAGCHEGCRCSTRCRVPCDAQPKSPPPGSHAGSHAGWVPRGRHCLCTHNSTRGTWPPRSLPPRFPGWQSALRLEGLAQARSLKNGPKHPPHSSPPSIPATERRNEIWLLRSLRCPRKGIV